jgi:uncharacterized membrane protein
MTTSWALAADGRFVEAVRAHATGTLLALAALVVGLAATIAAARGRRPAWQAGEATLAAAAVTLAGLVIGEWIVRLFAQ